MKINETRTDEDLLEQRTEESQNTLLQRVLPLIRFIASEFDITGIPGYDYDDLVQESCLAFLYAVKKYDKSRGAAFRTYLYTCVKSHLSNLSKKNKKPDDPQLVSIFENLSDIETDTETRLVDVLPCDDTEIDDKVMQEELSSSIISMASTLLSKNELTVFGMFYKEGLKPAEIAENSGCDVKSVENTLYRARAKLKKTLAELDLK